MATGANQRKPPRHGQGGGAGQADRPGPRKSSPQGGNVSDTAEAGGIELALKFLNLDQWKKNAAAWVKMAPSRDCGVDKYGNKKTWREHRLQFTAL